MEKMFYSASTGGFYHPEIHGEHGMPADVVEVTAEEYNALLNGQSGVKVIAADGNGRPKLVDRVFTDEEKAAVARNLAQFYLNDTDWYVYRKMETGKEIPDDVTKKRAEARATLS